MAKPLVSVIMINYNQEDYLVQSIESFLNQSYSNKELVIVDDGSTDQSAEIMKGYEARHDNIRVYYQSHCGSLPRLWNYANFVTRGDYALNLDSDDTLYADAIQTLVEQAETKGYDVCFGSMIYMDEHGSPLRPRDMVGAPYEPGRLIKHMYLSPPRLYKCSLFEKISGYNEALSPADDWDLYLKMEEISTNFGWTGKRPLYCYRKYEKSYSNTVDEETYQVARDAVRRNAIKRRNAQRILIVGRKWDEDYIILLRKEGNDVVSFFEESPEVSYLEQYNWYKPLHKRRFYSVFKLWRRCFKVLNRFKGDLILIKERLPFVLSLIIRFKTKDTPKNRLY